MGEFERMKLVVLSILLNGILVTCFLKHWKIVFHIELIPFSSFILLCDSTSTVIPIPLLWHTMTLCQPFSKLHIHSLCTASNRKFLVYFFVIQTLFRVISLYEIVNTFLERKYTNCWNIRKVMNFLPWRKMNFQDTWKCCWRYEIFVYDLYWYNKLTYSFVQVMGLTQSKQW